MVGSDRELLTLAARAANITFVRWNDGDEVYRGGFILEPSCIWCIWNPLTCDGDAFRLAVTLRIDVGAGRTPDGVEVCMASHGELFSGWFEEPYGEDEYAATRRAIVRAAAEIGRLRSCT